MIGYMIPKIDTNQYYLAESAPEKTSLPLVRVTAVLDSP